MYGLQWWLNIKGFILLVLVTCHLDCSLHERTQDFVVLRQFSCWGSCSSRVLNLVNRWHYLLERKIDKHWTKFCWPLPCDLKLINIDFVLFSGLIIAQSIFQITRHMLKIILPTIDMPKSNTTMIWTPIV